MFTGSHRVPELLPPLSVRTSLHCPRDQRVARRRTREAQRNEAGSATPFCPVAQNINAQRLALGRLRRCRRAFCALTSWRRTATPAPPTSPRVWFPAGALRPLRRQEGGCRPLCLLVLARMPHLENIVLCRESQVSTLQSLFGEVLWSNSLFQIPEANNSVVRRHVPIFKFLLEWGGGGGPLDHPLHGRGDVVGQPHFSLR